VRASRTARRSEDFAVGHVNVQLIHFALAKMKDPTSRLGHLFACAATAEASQNDDALGCGSDVVRDKFAWEWP
jgi:hypothetical protein